MRPRTAAFVTAAAMLTGCAGDASWLTATPAAREAFIQGCELAVRQQLQAPTTAKFARGQITGQTILGQAEYWGQVDAQNVMGVPLRRSFQCLGNANGSIVAFVNNY